MRAPALIEAIVVVALYLAEIEQEIAGLQQPEHVQIQQALEYERVIEYGPGPLFRILNVEREGLDGGI
jgi:hypothetical protein